MLKVGHIVRCEDHQGLWIIRKFTKGKAFRDQTYANVEKILEDDFSIPSKKQKLVCKVSMCHREYNTRLFENIGQLQLTITHLLKHMRNNE